MNNKRVISHLKIALTILFSIFAYSASAQVTIRVKIIDSATLQPIPDVSVFIVNSTIGAKTDVNGDYSFPTVAIRNYKVIASCVGYQTRQSAIFEGAGTHVINLSLLTRSIRLQEVTIASNNFWKRNLTLFQREFIGTTDEKECKITDPEILDIRFDDKANRLIASSADFLDIENNVLGYKLRFLVKDFWADYNTGKCHYTGTVIFEDLPGDKSKIKKWTKNRLQVYKGSFLHFLISLSNATLVKDKYLVKKLSRVPNPQWKADSIKRSQTVKAAMPTSRLGDGVVRNFYVIVPKMTESLEKKQLYEPDIMTASVQPGIFKLQFSGVIYVIYKNKPGIDTDDLHRQDEAGDHQTAALSLKDPGKPILFNSNGDLITQEGLLFEGAWNSRMIDLLPFDYKPVVK